MLFIGVLLVAVSALLVSSFLAVVGIAVAFWAAILIYVTPVKQVPLTFLNAWFNPSSSNLERVMTEFDLTEKGIYLPPKNLKSIESSLIFIPETAKTPLPKPDETIEQLYSKQKNGVFLTPPGLALSRIFEQELGISFAKTDIAHLQVTLPKVLIENLELAETAEIKTQGNTITVEMTDSILNETCYGTNDHSNIHTQVGCMLSSALACAFAKVIGKPVTIQNENQNKQTRTTTIIYQIKEE